VCGCGAWSQRLELEHTDVKALTDVSATDASFAQVCAAVCMCTRVPLSFCVQYSFAHSHLFRLFVNRTDLLVVGYCQVISSSTKSWSHLDLWLLGKRKKNDDALCQHKTAADKLTKKWKKSRTINPKH